MKNTTKKFSDVYCRMFQSSGFLTQIFAFPIAIVIFLNFFDLIFTVTSYEGEISLELLSSVKMDLIVLAVTGVFFASRFLLLFSKRKVSLWTSQIIWLATIAVIRSQISVPSIGVCAKNLLPAFGETIGFLLLAYLVFSPIRQIITLIASIVESYTKKESVKL